MLIQRGNFQLGKVLLKAINTGSKYNNRIFFAPKATSINFNGFEFKPKYYFTMDSDKGNSKPEELVKKEDSQGEETTEGGTKISKSQQKKLEKEAKKAAQKAANLEKEKAKQQAAEADDPLKGNYGDYDLLNDAEITGRKWVSVQELDDSFIGKEVLVRARFTIIPSIAI